LPSLAHPCALVGNGMSQNRPQLAPKHGKWVSRPNAAGTTFERRRPVVTNPQGQEGVHQLAVAGPPGKRPRLTGFSGTGVQSDAATVGWGEARRPHLGRPYALNAPPEGAGVADQVTPIAEWFHALAARLRRVRVCCGDWARVCTPAVTSYQGLTGVFLDPPYADTAGRHKDVYAVDSLTVAHAVREWAIAKGDDPLMRIALCGYEGEHVMPDSWSVFAWKTQGGYGNQHKPGRGLENRVRERIWFSPHCLSGRQWVLI